MTEIPFPSIYGFTELDGETRFGKRSEGFLPRWP